jgi:hypothetical protein
MSYIASNDNRFYTVLETEYGQVPDITEANRFPAVRLTANQTTEAVRRRDKTGTRSFMGNPSGTRRRTSYELLTFLTTWGDQSKPPAYGALFEAALGGSHTVFAGGAVASTPAPTRIQFQSSHGLDAGQAIAIGGELRFVTAVPNSTTVEINAPFSVTPPAGAEATPTVTYRPARTLPSVSLFDYWSPETALQRIVRGAAVDRMEIRLNSDFHEFSFRGPACDITDNRTLTGLDGEPEEFPAEPDSSTFDYSVVPGHLGQVWMGSVSDRFFTLTTAQITVANNVEATVREFGAERLRNIVAGNREVTIDFEMFASDDEQTLALHDAAKLRSGIRTMIQLGTQQGQLCGVYMKSVMPETPEFNDSDTRLAWRFKGSRAQGAGEDEIAVAFG